MLRDVRPRLALDYRVMTGLSGPMIRRVRGFVSSLDRFGGREAGRADGEAGRVTQYLVAVARPMLSAPDSPLHEAELLIDASMTGHSYPHSAPVVSVVSRPVPFSHRVQPQSGVVCIGSAWTDARGRMFMGHLIVLTLRWLGFDEPSNGDAGLNRLAFDYWRSRLGGKRLPCRIPYPILPDDVTHARPTAARPMFVASGTNRAATRAAPLFRARGAEVGPPTADVVAFRPTGGRG